MKSNFDVETAANLVNYLDSKSGFILSIEREFKAILEEVEIAKNINLLTHFGEFQNSVEFIHQKLKDIYYTARWRASVNFLEENYFANILEAYNDGNLKNLSIYFESIALLATRFRWNHYIGREESLETLRDELRKEL